MVGMAVAGVMDADMVMDVDSGMVAGVTEDMVAKDTEDVDLAAVTATAVIILGHILQVWRPERLTVQGSLHL
jgi:hypothetical protein